MPSAARAPSSSNRRIEADISVLKCGYLSKLSGKSRRWVKRWFVLKNDTLLVYKFPVWCNSLKISNLNLRNLTLQTDVTKKIDPIISIVTEASVISRDDPVNPVFQITNNKKTLYVSADSPQLATDWMNGLLFLVLFLITSIDKNLFSALQADGAQATSGWIVRMVHGKPKRCWMQLSDSCLKFYKDELSKV